MTKIIHKVVDLLDGVREFSMLLCFALYAQALWRMWERWKKRPL